MSALELLPFPSEDLPPSAYWAGLLAVCVATIATISRLSPLPFLMHGKPIRSLISFSRKQEKLLEGADACRAAVEEETELAEAVSVTEMGKGRAAETEMATRRGKGRDAEIRNAGSEKIWEANGVSRTGDDEEEENAGEDACRAAFGEETELAEAVSVTEMGKGRAAETEMLIRRGKGRAAEIRNAGSEKTREENGVSRIGEDEEEEENAGLNVPPLWVCSLLEASRVCPPRASVESTSNSKPFCSPITRCWSQALNARMCARLGKQWDISVSCRRHLLPYQYRSSHFWASDSLLECSCQQRDTCQLFQGTCQPSSSFFGPEMRPHNHAAMHPKAHSVMPLGFCNGKILLWDIENGIQEDLSYSVRRYVSTAAALTSLNGSSLAMAAGYFTVPSRSSVVSFWDDRCVIWNMRYNVDTLVERVSVACEAFEICIAGGGFASLHDVRMLRDMAIVIYAHKDVRIWDIQAQGRGSECRLRGNDVVESRDETVDRSKEFPIADVPVLSYDSHVHVDEAVKKRSRCSFLSDCLPLNCLLDRRSPVH